MQTRTVKVMNPTGFHLRPAGRFCEEAMKFEKTKITFQKGNKILNAKSLLAVLGACVKYGDEITLICEGEDEEAAVETMVMVVENLLGE